MDEKQANYNIFKAKTLIEDTYVYQTYIVYKKVFHELHSVVSGDILRN